MRARGYEITGTVTLDGVDLLDMEPEARAAAGVFLGFQYPVEIPGVNNMYFLRTAVNSVRRARGETEVGARDFLKVAKEAMDLVEMKQDFLDRAVNAGFSGGEKKRNEILQMALMQPRLAILDETDSGLDIDALRVIAGGVNALRGPERSMIVITHYQRLLDYIKPDFVHVLVDGALSSRATTPLLCISKTTGTPALSTMTSTTPPSGLSPESNRDDGARGGRPTLRANRCTRLESRRTGVLQRSVTTRGATHRISNSLRCRSGLRTARTVCLTSTLRFLFSMVRASSCQRCGRCRAALRSTGSAGLTCRACSMPAGPTRAHCDRTSTMATADHRRLHGAQLGFR